MVETGSSLFRMAAFFAVAGFLAALSQSKPNWLLHRIRQLLVPLAVLCLVMAAILYGLQCFGVTRDIWRYELPGYLWFLMALAVMSPILLELDRIGVSARISHWIERDIMAFLCVALFITVGVGLASSAIVWLWLRYDVVSFQPTAVFVLSRILPNLCFYALGFYIARSERCRTFLRTTPWRFVGLPIWVAAMLFFYKYGATLEEANGHRLLKVVWLQIATTTQFFMTLTILASALRIKTTPRWLKHLSQSAYSIYLLHQPFILIIVAIVIALGLDRGVNVYAFYALLVVGSFAASYFLHRLLIRKSALLLFLFNGKSLVLGRADFLRRRTLV